MAYALRLSADELARYRMMAERARAHEQQLWELAGLVTGARVADVGCGPGAMVVILAEIVGPSGHVVGIDGDEQAVKTAQAALATVGAANAEVRTGRADATGLAQASFDASYYGMCWRTTAALKTALSSTSLSWSAPAAGCTWSMWTCSPSALPHHCLRLTTSRHATFSGTSNRATTSAWAAGWPAWDAQRDWWSTRSAAGSRSPSCHRVCAVPPGLLGK